MISLLSRRGAVAVCIMLSACAAGPGGAVDVPGQGAGAFLAARYADAQNDPVSATRYYTMALRADPANQALAAEGFLAALLAGSPQAGVLAAQLPRNALATMQLGNEAAARGDFTQAAVLFGSLPKDDLGGLIKPLLLAWTSFGQGNEPAALNGLGPSFNSGVFGPVYVLNAALIADAAHDNKAAAQLYAAVSTDRPNLRLAQILASWQARQGDVAGATAQLSTLAAAHPDLQIALPALQAQVARPVINTAAQGIAEAYLTLAGSLDQPSEAFLRTVFLRFALQMRPDLSAARLLLASTQTGNNDPSATPTAVEMDNALETLRPIPADDPLYSPAALQQADLLAALNRPEAAVVVLKGLIAASPGDPGLLANAGDVLRGANRCPEAVPYYNQAIATLGGSPPAGAWTLWFDKGVCEDEMGDWAAAEPDMLYALKLSPDQPYVLNYLGYSWALHGEKLTQAKAMLTRAVGLDPNDGAVIDSLGFVEMRLGNNKSAVTLLTQAVELDPDDAEVNAHLGDAFWQAGYKLEADYQWQRALALHPDHKLEAEISAKVLADFGPSH